MLDNYIDTLIELIPEPIKKPFRWIFNADPNTYTYLRISAIVPLILCLSYRYYLSALIVFAIAALTDIVDGYLARKTKNITPTGIIFDPVADKVIFLSAFIMTSHEVLCSTIYWFIIIGESTLMVITFLALVMPRQRKNIGVKIGSNCWGKFKMLTESIGIGLLFIYLKNPNHLIALIVITLFILACIFIVLSLQGHLKTPLTTLLKK
ncbi:MAG: CDP-alcohol phosphatidyltransferase family protein [bacterium]